MEPKSTDIRVELVAASGLQPLKNLVRQKNRKNSGFHKKILRKLKTYVFRK